MFSSLAADPEVQLTVHYRIGTAKLYYWNLLPDKGYPYRVFKRPYGIDWKLVRILLGERGAFYVLTGIKGPTKAMAAILLSTLKRNFAFWTDTPPDDYFAAVRGWLRRPVFALMFRKAAAIMTTGTPGRRFFIRQGVPNEKIIDLPFFWDLTPPVYEKSEMDGASRFISQYASEDDFVFLMSGKLVESKRLDLAIEAAALLMRNTARKDIKVLVAGEGPDRRRLLHLITKMGLRSHFHLLGWLDGSPLHAFFLAGHAFLHTAPVDPFPTVVLKAMVYGKPVLGFAGAGSVADRVKDGENGFVIESGNVHQLAERMQFCVEERERCAEMGRAARRTAEEWPVERGVENIKHAARGSRT